MDFMKKVTQRLLQVRRVGRLLKEEGIINTMDVLVATAAIVVIAAGVGGASLSTLDASRYAKAQPDGQAISQALTNFYKDTGKWPGQAEDALATGSYTLLATGAVVPAVPASGTVGQPGYTAAVAAMSTFGLPSVANYGLAWTGQTNCGSNSGQGFVNAAVGGYASTSATTDLPTTNVLNLNDYLVRKPDGVKYPNWAGPYVQEISGDPWDRSWVAYLAPLYCAEAVTSTNGAGNLGYAWLIAGGTNRTITTPATSGNLDPLGDDVGANLGKLTVPN